MGRDYWLGFPHGYDPTKTYWLVAVAHGAGGTGESLKSWTMPTARTDYIVVSPSYPRTPKDGYFQTLGGESDTQLMDLFKKLKLTYRLRDQMFLYGFSAGAQFSHRFTMAHPELVVGCSAHSAGTWGPAISGGAMGVPMFFSCGLDDIQPSVKGALPRVEEAERYFSAMKGKKMFAKMRYWEGVAHSGTNGKNLTGEVFELATTGVFPNQRAAIEAEIARIDGLIAASKMAEAKASLNALPKFKLPVVAQKEPKWTALVQDQKVNQRPAFVKDGAGGRSKLGRDFWIDDSDENQYGWNDNPVARNAMQARFRSWITEQAGERLAKIQESLGPVKGGK